MSANNYIQIKEISPNEFSVSEKDYESEGEIEDLGIFDSMRLAVKKAEDHIQEIENEVEYGIRFSLLGEESRAISSKDFDSWNMIKKDIHSSKPRVFFSEREIWWCSLGTNVGDEQDGKGKDFYRPILVFKKFNNMICWAIPLTTRTKFSFQVQRFYAQVRIEDGVARNAMISQLRLLDGKRFFEKIGVIDEDNYSEIKKAISAIVEP